MNKEKAKAWLGVLLALLPAVKLAGQVLGLPFLDFNHIIDIVTAVSGGAGVALVAKSEKVGK